MATIAANPIVLNNIALTLGSDNFEAVVNKVILTPAVPLAKWKGMTPGSAVTLAGDPEWVLELQFAQDHVTAASLSRYLLLNVGKVVPFSLKPVKPATGTSPTYSGNVVALPGAIGGDLDASNAAVANVSLPVNGALAYAVA